MSQATLAPPFLFIEQQSFCASVFLLNKKKEKKTKNFYSFFLILHASTRSSSSFHLFDLD